MRSSPLVPETVPVCRQCHKNCLSTVNNCVKSTHSIQSNITEYNNKDAYDNKNKEDDWRPLLLMGLSAINPAASLVKLDPFSAPIPQINVAPPTPENLLKTACTTEFRSNKDGCSCQSRPEVSVYYFYLISITTNCCYF